MTVEGAMVNREIVSKAILAFLVMCLSNEAFYVSLAVFLMLGSGTLGRWVVFDLVLRSALVVSLTRFLATTFH